VVLPSRAEVVAIGAYPGAVGSAVRGVLAVQPASAGGITVRGTVVGLPPGTAGWHVHAGYSCDSGDGVFGHHTLEDGTDPFLGLTYTADATG
jgi:Cu/Zn superoxide dismutase